MSAATAASPRVSLIVIATGRYLSFLEPLLASARRHVVGLDRVFVLSDVRPPDDPTVRWLPWGHLPWPYPTLLRYRAISAYRSVLQQTDVLLYVDVDMLFVGTFDVSATTGLVAVRHPGFATSSRAQLPYEGDVRSRAFVPPELGTVYVAGGVQGGRAGDYLDACELMASEVQLDLDQGIVPTWHDESVWNAFCARRPPDTLLSVHHCTPEKEAGPETLLLALDKDHDHFREVPPLARARRRLQRQLQRVRAAVVRTVRPVVRAVRR